MTRHSRELKYLKCQNLFQMVHKKLRNRSLFDICLNFLPKVARSSFTSITIPVMIIFKTSELSTRIWKCSPPTQTRPSSQYQNSYLDLAVWYYSWIGRRQCYLVQSADRYLRWTGNSSLDVRIQSNPSQILAKAFLLAIHCVVSVGIQLKVSGARCFCRARHVSEMHLDGRQTKSSGMNWKHQRRRIGREERKTWNQNHQKYNQQDPRRRSRGQEPWGGDK